MIPDPPTLDWLRARLDQAEISQVQAAHLLRVDDRTMRRWCAGDRAIPWASAVLLDALLHVRSEHTDSAILALQTALNYDTIVNLASQFSSASPEPQRLPWLSKTKNTSPK